VRIEGRFPEIAMPTSPSERDDSGPWISVVIPSSNAAAFLGATIEAIYRELAAK
jgi:hypothetical protein